MEKNYKGGARRDNFAFRLTCRGKAGIQACAIRDQAVKIPLTVPNEKR